jgi:hypothetical protein
VYQSCDGRSCSQKPTITGISPANGPYYGNTIVTVTGTGLNMGSPSTVPFTKFTIGGQPVIPNTPYSQNFSTPASNPGVVDVVACNGNGTCPCSDRTPADQFTYTPPSISSISPSSGPITGGTQVCMAGSGLNDSRVPVRFFFGNAQVTQPMSNCYASGPSEDGGAVTSPAVSSPGAVQVKVNAFGVITPSNALFTYEQYPRIVSIDWRGYSNGWIKLNGNAPPGGALITLTSSDPTAITGPKTVLVPQGTSEVSYGLAIPPSSTAKTVTLTASYQGSSASTNVSIGASAPIRISVTGADLEFNNSTTGIVYLALPNQCATEPVKLTSSISLVILKPSPLSISATSGQGSFSVNSQYAGPPQTVTITAACGSLSATTSLKLNHCTPRQCSTGSTWNQTTCACTPPPKPCPKGTFRDPDTGLCTKTPE